MHLDSEYAYHVTDPYRQALAQYLITEYIYTEYDSSELNWLKLLSEALWSWKVVHLWRLTNHLI